MNCARRVDRARKDYFVSRFLFSSNASSPEPHPYRCSPRERECDKAKLMAIPVRTKRRRFEKKRMQRVVLWIVDRSGELTIEGMRA
jgi:hypothetical protein